MPTLLRLFTRVNLLVLVGDELGNIDGLPRLRAHDLTVDVSWKV